MLKQIVCLYGLLHLYGMKNKVVVTNVFLIIAVLFALLFQSFDSCQHLEKQFSEKNCHHQYSGRNSELTHQHHNFDHCAVCDFTFSSFISPDLNFYCLRFSYSEIPYIICVSKTPLSFSGSAYLLRGPPCPIV